MFIVLIENKILIISNQKRHQINKRKRIKKRITTQNQSQNQKLKQNLQKKSKMLLIKFLLHRKNLRVNKDKILTIKMEVKVKINKNLNINQL